MSNIDEKVKEKLKESLIKEIVNLLLNKGLSRWDIKKILSGVEGVLEVDIPVSGNPIL